MATAIKQRLDYGDLGSIPDDRNRYELLDGRLYVTPSPNTLHQRVSRRLQRQLEEYFEGLGKGIEVFNAPFDVILTRHDIVIPDLVVTEPEKLTARALEGTPLVAVEILSPSTASYDRGAKAERLARLGVPHYWLVDPETQRIDCFRLAGAAYELLVSAASPEPLEHPDFPGLRIDLAGIWRESAVHGPPTE